MNNAPLFQRLDALESKQLQYKLETDEKSYHLGTSLKDLGKKWYAFSLIEEDAFELNKEDLEVLDGK